MTLSRKIASSMATAIDRANTLTYAELPERHKADQRTIDELRQKLLASERRAYDAEQGGASSTDDQTINGRPVMTLAQAARAANLKYHTARRRVEKGKWEAVEQAPDRHRYGVRDIRATSFTQTNRWHRGMRWKR